MLLGGLLYLTKHFCGPKGFVRCRQHDKQSNHCHDTAELERGSLPSGSTCAWDQVTMKPCQSQLQVQPSRVSCLLGLLLR
jgi:hypothetical protein